MSAISPVASSGNRIDGISAQPLVEEEIVKEPTRDNALSNGVLRKLAACQVTDLDIILDHSPSASSLGSSSLEAGDVTIYISFIGFQEPFRVSDAKVSKEILDRTCVGIDGLRTFAASALSARQRRGRWHGWQRVGNVPIVLLAHPYFAP
jgi:hypothetical protein